MVLHVSFTYLQVVEKGHSVVDYLDQAGLWTCLWGIVIANLPSLLWAASFPGQGGTKETARKDVFILSVFLTVGMI